MATIKDVARKSGVSTTTVSFVLNGTGSVGQAAQKRVRDAARELGYSPNPLARAMITKRTMSLGVLVNGVASFTSAMMLNGIEAEARKGGYEILLALHRDEPSTALSALHSLMARRVDALIAVFAKSDEHPEIGAALPAADIPYVIAYYNRAEPPKDDVPFDNVVADQEQGGRLAGEHLIARGRTHLAYAGGPTERNATHRRLFGFQEACAARGGIVLPENAVLFDEFRVPAGERMGEQLLKTYPTLDGVFAADDSIGAGLLRAFRRAGKRVPEDIAIVGFNDSAISGATDPALTTVRMPLEAIGSQCVLRAIDRLTRPNQWVPQTIALPCTLTVREST